MASLDRFKPYPKSAQVPPKRPKITKASRARIAEIRGKKIDGQPCRVCGASEGIQAHHLILRSLQGQWTESNIVPLCGPCHADVSEMHRDACAKLRLTLTDAELSYVVEKAGENFLDRYYPVDRETFGRQP